jgi:hypothetical protein
MGISARVRAKRVVSYSFFTIYYIIITSKSCFIPSHLSAKKKSEVNESYIFSKSSKFLRSKSTMIDHQPEIARLVDFNDFIKIIQSSFDALCDEERHCAVFHQKELSAQGHKSSPFSGSYRH